MLTIQKALTIVCPGSLRSNSTSTSPISASNNSISRRWEASRCAYAARQVDGVQQLAAAQALQVSYRQGHVVFANSHECRP